MKKIALSIFFLTTVTAQSGFMARTRHIVTKLRLDSICHQLLKDLRPGAESKFNGMPAKLLAAIDGSNCLHSLARIRPLSPQIEPPVSLETYSLLIRELSGSTCPNARNHLGQTARDVAESEGNSWFIEAIETNDA